MSIARRYVVVIATFACTAALIVATGCSSCVTKPVTTERKGPELMLNLVDLLNSKNNLKNIAAQRYNGSVPPLSLSEANYNYLFFIVATDSGGISSFDYSEAFSTGCPCNPGSNSCGGSLASGSETITPNPDGTVPTLQFEIINVSASQEKTAVGCPSSFAGNVPGTYTIKAKATNPSGKKTETTWIINIS